MVYYYTTFLSIGIDGKGIAILRYKDFDVTLMIGKTAATYLQSEIYGLHETIRIGESAADIHEIKLYNRDEVTLLSMLPTNNPMLYEAQAFSRMIEMNDHITAEKYLYLSKQVNQVLYDLRSSAEIEFAADIDC